MSARGISPRGRAPLPAQPIHRPSGGRGARRHKASGGNRLFAILRFTIPPICCYVLPMRLFMPGRICLFGEHSDWAGGYRRVNAAIEPGMAIITGTNQGIHAEIRPHPGKLILRTTLEDGTRPPPFEVPMLSLIHI